MAPKAGPTKDFVSRISIIYRVYFLWFEPLAALAGTYLCFFDPEYFINVTVPSPALAAAYPVTPVLQMMMQNLGCLYALFAINEGIVLRLTREKSVWYTVLLSMIVTDLGHGKLAPVVFYSLLQECQL